MNRLTTIRKSPQTALKGAVGCVLAAVFAAGVAMGQSQAPRQQMSAPIVRQAPPLPQPLQQRPVQPQQNRPNGYNPAQPTMRPYNSPAQMGPQQQHLAAWMNAHRNLTLDQQQRALGSERGFQQLQPAEQQRIRQRLTQLNEMAPGQRERTLARTEAMERLAPAQRQQVRSALSDLGGLPEERRRAVARTFRALRDMPEGQRQAYMNSPQVRGQLSDRERYVLGNLFAVEPYLPPPVAAPR